MKIKQILTIVLLVFVFDSVVYLVIDEFRPENAPALSAEGDLSKHPETSQADLSTNQQPAQKVILYYFHGTMRCITCRKFESFTKELLQKDFQDELKSGILEWRIVNVDRPGNKHFVNDYQLHTKSIVVVKIHDGKQIEWKNMDKIWDMVGNKAVFVDYIKSGVDSYMETN